MVTILPLKYTRFVLPPWRNAAWPSPQIHINSPQTYIKKNRDEGKDISLYFFGLLRISRWRMDGGGGRKIFTDRFIKESKKKPIYNQNRYHQRVTFHIWYVENNKKYFWRAAKASWCQKGTTEVKLVWWTWGSGVQRNKHLGFKWVTQFWSNNIIHSSAYQLKAREIANSTIPSLCQPAH